MIHMYTVNELEDISGITRRTIGDYIAKGLLAGPSHRGRGARYSQSDADVLQIIPRLRTLMKKEFPSLREVHDFLAHRSAYELNSLANKSSEAAFEREVRTLRLHHSLAAILPQVSPERINLALKQLTPEQITAVDTGRYPIGAVVDMAGLLNERELDAMPSGLQMSNAEMSVPIEFLDGQAEESGNGAAHTSWNVNWLDGSSYSDSNEFAAEVGDISALDLISRRLERMASDTDMDLVRHETVDDFGISSRASTDSVAAIRLADIAERVERLERLLESK